MDKINIEGVILTDLKRISHPKGDILHGMKRSDSGFAGFGEVYFSTIKGGHIKGWNKHNEMTLNFVVPFGSATFILIDARIESKSKGNMCQINIGLSNYKRLTIPSGIWVGFKGQGKKDSLILNIASTEHDPNEMDKLDLNQFNIDWNSV